MLFHFDEEDIRFLEQLLSNKYDSNELANYSDIVSDYFNPNDIVDQCSLVAYFTKFIKFAKKFKHISNEENVVSSTCKYSKASLGSKCISSSVDLLVYNNRNDEESHCGGIARYSPWKPQRALFKSSSLPNISLECRTPTRVAFTLNDHVENVVREGSFSCDESESISDDDNFCPPFSSDNTSTSSSNSNELNFLAFKEILKRNHMSSIVKYRLASTRPFSSACPGSRSIPSRPKFDSGSGRSKTTTGVHLESASEMIPFRNHSNLGVFTPTTNSAAFSNNSLHLDLGEFAQKFFPQFLIKFFVWFFPKKNSLFR